MNKAMSKIYEAIRESLGLEGEVTECTTTLNELIERDTGYKREADHGELMDIIYKIGLNPTWLKTRFDPHRITKEGKELLSGLALHLGATSKEYFNMITKGGDGHYIGNLRPLEFLYLKYNLTK